MPYLEMDHAVPLLNHRLQNRDEAAFEQVFKEHYKNLHAYAISMIRDEAPAEEVVQNVFYRLWERADRIDIPGSVAAYLYRSVHNEALNYLKHLKVRSDYQLYVSHRSEDHAEHAAKQLQHKELQQKIKLALNDLPEQCRTIFQMSRFEELRYKEIAERLDLSVKTVENQIGKALKILRSKLTEFLIFILIILHAKH